MENIINYYYNLNVDALKDYTNYLLIKSNSRYFVFKEYLGKLDELKNIITLLNQNNIKYDRILLNRENNPITKYNNKDYILIELIQDNREINNNFFIIKSNINSKNNSEIWSKMIEQINNPKSAINNYYIGLTESAIALYNRTLLLDGDINYVISHYRINYPNYSINYLDPTKMLVDVLGRDIAEYVKSKFFNNNITIEETIKMIDKYQLNDKEINIMISRLLFPSYYFDLLKNNEKEDKYISKAEEYEKFIYQLTSLLSKKHYIIEIDWLKKRTNGL